MLSGDNDVRGGVRSDVAWENRCIDDEQVIGTIYLGVKINYGGTTVRSAVVGSELVGPWR